MQTVFDWDAAVLIAAELYGSRTKETVVFSCAARARIAEIGEITYGRATAAEPQPVAIVPFAVPPTV